MNFLVSHTCEIRFNEVIGQSTIPRYPLGFLWECPWARQLQSPSLVLVKPKNNMNNVSCQRDMTDILLKVA